MTTSPKTGGGPAEGARPGGPEGAGARGPWPPPPKSTGKAITLVGPRLPKVSRFRRAMARSFTRVRESSPSAHPKALKIFRAFSLGVSGFRAVFLCRLFIQIVMGPGLFGGGGILDALVKNAA